MIGLPTSGVFFLATALILFAHGARDPEWAAPLRRVQAAIQAQCPESRVELAFLELMAPSLADCVAGLVAADIRRIAVLPMFIAQGGHLKRDLPQLLAGLADRFPGVELALAPAVGESDPVVAAMAAVGAELLA